MSIIFQYTGSTVTGLSITTPGALNGTGVSAETLSSVNVIAHFKSDADYGSNFNTLGFRTQVTVSALGQVIYAQVRFATGCTDFFILAKNADTITYNADGRAYFYFDTGANIRFGDSGGTRGTMAATVDTYYDLKWECVAGGEFHGYARTADTPGEIVPASSAWTDLGTSVGQFADTDNIYIVTNHYNGGTAGSKKSFVSEIIYTSDGTLTTAGGNGTAGGDSMLLLLGDL